MKNIEEQEDKYTKLRQCIYSRTVNVIMTYIKD